MFPRHKCVRLRLYSDAQSEESDNANVSLINLHRPKLCRARDPPAAKGGCSLSEDCGAGRPHRPRLRLPCFVAFEDDRSKVLAAADIVRVIGDHVTLKPKGRERVGLCPFHDDRSPSMYVVPHKQMYHCFVCGAGGNAITFVMEYHKMSFREALAYLADRFGVKLTPWQPRQITTGGGAEGAGGGGGGETVDGGGVSREQLIHANATAQAYFRTLLQHEEHGARAREVFIRRGVSAEMIAQFGLGTSVERWDGLVLTLQHKRVETKPFVAGGLLKQRDGGHLYDALRNRITFPICDVLGRVIAFGARRIDDADEPKYLNSPETLLFNKSATLYGIHHAAETIRKKNVAVVCEGYMDAIACHQAGITHVVATLGTALTAQSARVLGRFCDTVVLLFDGDEAGQRAADRAIEVLFASSIDVKIATLADVPLLAGRKAKDPDELLKMPGGAEMLGKAFENAVDALDYRYTRLAAAWRKLSLSAKAEAVNAELSRLVELGLGRVAPVRKQMIIRRICDIASIDEHTIRRVLGDTTARARAAAPATSPAGIKVALPMLRTAEDHLLACILNDGKLLEAKLTSPDELGELLSPSRMRDPHVARLASLVLEHLEDHGAIDDQVLSLLDDPALLRVATQMVAEVSRQCEASEIKLRRHFTECLLTARRGIAAEPRAMLTAISQVALSASVESNKAAGAEMTSGEHTQPVDSVAERIKRLQHINATLGRNARQLPRPPQSG